jgi:hypothetical protein
MAGPFGDISSDASQPATYGSTTGFNAANTGSGIDWQAALKTLSAGSAASDTQPVAIPPLQAQQPNIPQSTAVGSHLGFTMRDVIELLYKRQQAYQAAGMNQKGGVVPPDFSAPMGLLGIR